MSAGNGRGDPRQRTRTRGRGPRRWPRGPLALALSVAVTTSGLGGCGAGRDVLGTSTSPCFLALAVAKRAVEGRGSLAGVRLVDIPKLTGSGDRALRDLLGLLPVYPPPRDVCLVAYAGSFTLTQVELPFGPAPSAGPGRYAVAVVTTPEPALVGTFILRRRPSDFTHAHAGFLS